MGSEKEIVTSQDVQVTVEEVDLSTDPQKPKAISISSKLSEEEKEELILLLKEFRDVFAWDYNEMSRIDAGLMVRTLNVDPKAKPVAQPDRVFHIGIEKKNSEGSTKVVSGQFHQTHPIAVVVV